MQFAENLLRKKFILQGHTNTMLKHDRRKLKNLSRHKWTNPNKFNAITAILAFLIFTIVISLLQYLVIPILSQFISGKISIGLLLCISALFSQLTILLVAIVFCKIKKVKLFGGGISLKFDFKICLPALVLSLGTMFFITPLHTQFATDLGYFQEHFFGSSSLTGVQALIEPIDIIWLLLYVVILAPVLPSFCEEALFRGVIMNGFKEFGTFFAVIASGAIFALMHGNYGQLILQFILGCEIAFVVIVTNNYFAGMVMHFANNSVTVIYSLILAMIQEVSPALGAFANAFFIFIGLILVCIAIIYYYKLLQFRKRTEEEGMLGGNFIFYRKGKNVAPCCLLQKGVDVDYCFSVSEERVANSDNSNFLFFSGKKFYKFSKESNKKLFTVLFILGILGSLALILLNFFLVG